MKFMEQLTGAADLPDAPIPGQPLIEITGEKRVLIEHHCGVSNYTRQQIAVKVKFGQILISGDALVLTRMTKNLLIISGCIESVHLIKGG